MALIAALSQLSPLLRSGSDSAGCGSGKRWRVGASVSKFNRAAKKSRSIKCATCGATELTDPNLEFRVARDGEEYCLAHLPRPANAPV